MQKNPGKANATSFRLDGPEAAAMIPNEEWASIKGQRSLGAYLAYLQALGRGKVERYIPEAVAADNDDR